MQPCANNKQRAWLSARRATEAGKYSYSLGVFVVVAVGYQDKNKQKKHWNKMVEKWSIIDLMLQRSVDVCSLSQCTWDSQVQECCFGISLRSGNFGFLFCCSAVNNAHYQFFLKIANCYCATWNLMSSLINCSICLTETHREKER